MSKDIRSFFSPKSVSAKNTASQNVQSRAAPKHFLSDSDSDEEVPKKSKNKPPKKYAKLDIKKIKSVVSSDDEHEPEKQAKVENHKDNVKKSRKRKGIPCLESSDEDVPNEQVSSKVRKKSTNSTTAKPKHFKPANPEDVFGTEPVKQSRSEITKLYTEKETPNETKTDNSSTSGFEKDEKQIGHTKKNNDDHTENEDDLKKWPTKKNKDHKAITSPAKTANGQSIKQNAELVQSPTNKKPRNRDSPGDFSSPSCQKKSSPESSFKLSSPDTFVDSQDSGIVMKKSESKKYPKGSSPSEVRTNAVNSVPLTPQSTPVESKSRLESKDAKTTIDSSPALWVEKYKPTSSSKLVGQQTPGSNVNKLKNWLINWHKNNSGHKKVTSASSGWSMDPYGTNFKAALLSGPPGVGKTTTVQLLCKELGFDMVEFNASDTRSKNLLHTQVSELLTSTSLNSSTLGKSGDMTVNRKRVLVMDEVDGMAGNEDRGGIQELISLIKRSKVPVICICNDRSHPKIRSLVNYCFDLRYSKPRIEQIRGYMMSICYREKMTIPSDVLTDIIANTNNDIRLTLNHLSMLAADKTNTNLTSDKKNVKIGPWDILRKVFSAEDHKTMSIYDKCDLFFYDYNIASLFVHENYLSVKPNNPVVKNKVKKMELFAEAADSLATGDVIESVIRKSSAWSLLPVQAIFSSYVPGFLLEGHCGGQINFPSWFAQNSKQSKMSRLLQEIQIHTRLKISGSRLAILLDYANHIRNSVLSPLLQDGADGVKTSFDRLRSYDLLRDDLDNLNELCTWSQTENLFSKVDSKVKAAFTRLYNKEAPVCPYSLSVPIKSRKLNNDAVDQYDEENEEDEELDDDNEDADAMIVEKKKPSKSVKPEKRVDKKGSDPPSTSKKASRGKKTGGNKKK